MAQMIHLAHVNFFHPEGPLDSSRRLKSGTFEQLVHK